MITILLLTLLLLSACTADNNIIVPNLSISLAEGGNLDGHAINIAEEGGQEIVNIESNSSWLVKSNAEWVALSKQGGEGNGYIILTAEASEKSRSAAVEIYLSNYNQIRKSFDIIQYVAPKEEQPDDNTGEDNESKDDEGGENTPEDGTGDSEGNTEGEGDENPEEGSNNGENGENPEGDNNSEQNPEDGSGEGDSGEGEDKDDAEQNPDGDKDEDNEGKEDDADNEDKDDSEENPEDKPNDKEEEDDDDNDSDKDKEDDEEDNNNDEDNTEDNTGDNDQNDESDDNDNDSSNEDDENNNEDNNTGSGDDENDDSSEPTQGAYLKISKLARLSAGQYYIGGYQGDVLHLATKGINVGHCNTVQYTFTDTGDLIPAEEKEAVIVTLEKAKSNGYYIRFKEGYLTATAAGPGKLVLSEEKSEYWIFSAHPEGGFILRQSGNIDVQLIISPKAKNGSLLRSIAGDEEGNAIILFRKNE